MGFFDLFRSNKKNTNIERNDNALIETEYEKYIVAADQGNPKALYKIGLCYYEGGRGVEQNYKKAIEYFLSASMKGNADSDYWLGLMYERGEGVVTDLKKSFEFFKCGAEKGDYAAEAMLGRNYLYGIGTGKNLDLAYKWLSKTPQDIFFSGYYLGEYYTAKGEMSKAIDILERTLASSGGGANRLEARELLRELYLKKNDAESIQKAKEIEQQQKYSSDLLDRLAEMNF